ncbi:hypothetical protein ACVGW2_00310, partial [Enterobacter intestinihominis]
FLHKKAGWGGWRSRASFCNFSGPGMGSRHPGKKTPSGDKNLNPLGKICGELNGHQTHVGALGHLILHRDRFNHENFILKKNHPTPKAVENWFLAYCF